MSAQRRNFWQFVHRPRFWLLVLLGLATIGIVRYNPMPRGLTGKYYDNPDWRGTPLLSVREHTIDVFRMRREFPSIRASYGIQWTGVIFIAASGVHEFMTISDDGSELWIDDILVVDNRGFHGIQKRTGRIDLQRGLHVIVIRYMQGDAASEMSAHWTPPGQAQQRLDDALLFAKRRTAMRYFWWYQARQVLLPVLAVAWGAMLIFGANRMCSSRVLKWRFCHKFNPITVKLGVFLIINGILLNLAIDWWARSLPGNTPLVSHLNTGLYCTKTILTTPIHDRFDSWFYLYRALEFFSVPQQTTVYTALNHEQGMKFQYPPTSLLFVAPLHKLSLETFISTLNLMSWIVVLLTIGLLSEIFKLSWQESGAAKHIPCPGKWARLLLALGFTVTFYPLTWSFRLGQIQTWIYGLFVGTVLAWMTGKKELSGGLIGLICLIKPQLGLFALWGLARKQWRFVIGIGVPVLFLGLTSLYLYGLDNHLEYIEFLSFMSKYGESYHPNQSVNGLLQRALFNGPNLSPSIDQYPPYHPWIYVGTLVSSAILVVLAVLWKRGQHPQSLTLDFAIAAVTFTMASPIAWMHHYSVLLPIFAAVFPMMFIVQSRQPFLSAWFTLTFMLTSNFYYITNALAKTPWNVLQSAMFFGAVLLLVLLYRFRAQEGSVIFQSEVAHNKT